MQERAFRAYEELRRQKLLRAIGSERQLEAVLVDFWFNHFNVAAWKGPVWLYLTEYERDAIRPHVLGRFRDLLGAVAESPAMVFYLDNWLSSDPDGPDPVTVARDRDLGLASRAIRSLIDLASPGSEAVPDRLRRAIYDRERAPGVNENYARELLELHTLGVDGGYTQADVVVNVSLNLIAIPRYGFVGAAVTTVIAEGLVFPLTYFQVRSRVRRLPALRYIWTPLFCCLPMLATLHLTVGAHLLVRVPIGVVSYAVAAWLVGGYNPREVVAGVSFRKGS